MLALQTRFSNPSLAVACDVPRQLLQVTWRCQPASRDYREDMTRIAALALAEGVERVLFDVRRRTFLELRDQNWVLREILPLFRGRTIRFAYLISALSVGLMDTYRMQKEVSRLPRFKGKFTLEIFLDSEEAQQWLLAKGEVLP